MPLTYASIGQMNKVIKVKGQEKVKKFLESLGFVEGSDVVIVSQLSGNVIVNIKQTRVAISKEMANKIIVKEG
ncbi:MAG: FeoA domain-containing protein [Coprobacillus sp.]